MFVGFHRKSGGLISAPSCVRVWRAPRDGEVEEGSGDGSSEITLPERCGRYSGRFFKNIFRWKWVYRFTVFHRPIKTVTGKKNIELVKRRTGLDGWTMGEERGLRWCVYTGTTDCLSPMVTCVVFLDFFFFFPVPEPHFPVLRRRFSRAYYFIYHTRVMLQRRFFVASGYQRCLPLSYVVCVCVFGFYRLTWLYSIPQVWCAL